MTTLTTGRAQAPRRPLEVAGPRTRLLTAMTVLALLLGMPAGWAVVVAGEGGGAPATASGVLLGNVRDSAGAVVEGAKVQVRNYDAGDVRLEGSTDAEGRFRIERLEPGRILAWVELGDLIKTHDEVITIAAGVNRHDLLCPRREIRGRVLSAAGQPVAGAFVVMNGGDFSAATRERHTGPDGTFSFLVLDGWCTLFVDAKGFRPYAFAPPFRVDGTSRDVEIRLQPAPPAGGSIAEVRGKGAAISGRVTGLAPAELAKAMILAYPPGSGHQRSADLDATGRYRIVDVEPPGEWDLTAEAGAKKMQRAVNVPPDAGREVEGVDVVFPQYFAVSGRVRNANGSASGHDRLTFDDLGQADSYSTSIGPQGSFSIALPTGKYRVAADDVSDSLPNFSALARKPVVVNGKARRGLEIRLDATGRIAGQLSGGEAGQPMTDMTVRASQGHLSQDGKVDDRGHYEIGRLIPGPSEVRAWSGDGDIAAAKVNLPANAAQTSVDLSFRPGPLTLSGRLAGFDPEAHYLVSIERAEGRYDSHLIGVNHDGTFSRSGLVPGNYRMEVEDTGMPLEAHWPLYTDTVDLLSDRSLVLNLTFPP
ncbi:MAG TPA: carboxypeptidase-like regulatory domain-containing protein [Thermoanaerobaculia bacterium]